MKFEIAFVVLACMLTPGCTKKSAAKKSVKSQTPVVVTTNAPVNYFATQLGGDDFKFLFPIGPGIDPAYWQPTAEEIEAVQQADLILANGATYEKWMRNASLPESKIVDTSAAFKKHWIETTDGVIHSHGPDGAHTHVGTAFTTWIDFSQALQQAIAVKESLIKLAPDAAETINANFKKLESDLKSLDERMASAAKSIGDQPLVVSHPVYHYWTRRYQLNTQSVHFEPDEEPSAVELEKLRKLLINHPAKFIIWESEPLIDIVKLMEGMGLRSVVFAPGGNRSDNLDWHRQMQINIANLKVIFENSN